MIEKETEAAPPLTLLILHYVHGKGEGTLIRKQKHGMQAQQS